MRLALEEAKRGLGRTSPLPLSGAVLVKAGRVVGRGFRKGADGPDAVTQALAEAGARARGAALYTLLPPGAEDRGAPSGVHAIAEARVASVWCAWPMAPRATVRSKAEGALGKLRRLGIEVRTGVLADEARQLNRPYFKYREEGLPWVTLKAAATLDGKLATHTGSSRWITGPQARERVHRLRDVVDVIMVGANTALLDNPQLTTRLPEGGGRDARRVVVDGKLRVHPRLELFRQASGERTIVATTVPETSPRARALSRAGAQLWHFAPSPRTGALPLRALLSKLAEGGARHVLVEGGAQLFAALLGERLADELWLFLAPKLIGGDGLSWIGPLGIAQMPEALSLTDVTLEPCGPDFLMTGLLAYSVGGSSR